MNRRTAIILFAILPTVLGFSLPVNCVATSQKIQAPTKFNFKHESVSAIRPGKMPIDCTDSPFTESATQSFLSAITLYPSSELLGSVWRTDKPHFV